MAVVVPGKVLTGWMLVVMADQAAAALVQAGGVVVTHKHMQNPVSPTPAVAVAVVVVHTFILVQVIIFLAKRVAVVVAAV